jgi:hypothetical protein
MKNLTREFFVHAAHAVETGYSDAGIVIKSQDTDVAILACMLCTTYPSPNLFFGTGTKQRTRFIPLHTVAAKLADNVCSALVGLHAFIGCDSTSASVGKGKKTVFEN